ncbi:hypothetical protein FHU41_001363 [Psychromicrobium silvestre]|uniref:Glyoxalase-like domain-containing protein n=1 Tax=Psychromicrobium silvestre TaxID=1645614 RepID=A0A7Y9LT74_9MICC|nr:VOC family protein [Psychromicrobium silvestre]NYE95142.1 hypothetical protein [Psychromicrobium silvestre]
MNSEQTFRSVGVRGVRIDAADPDAARAFYSTMTRHHGQRESGGSSNAVRVATKPLNLKVRRRPGTSPWTIAFGVTDLAAAVSACLALGARELASSVEDDWGLLEDPQGAQFAVVQAEAAENRSVTQGDIPLADLYTRHVDEATAFYSAAFRMEVDIQPDGHADDPSFGEPIDYVKFCSQGRHLAGVIDMSSFVDPAIPDQWIPYLHFTEVDAGIERATALGAWVVVPRMETPTGDYALLQDPGGALFGIWDARSLSLDLPVLAAVPTTED